MRQFGPHRVAHRQTDNLAHSQVKHGRETHPALTGRDIHDVGEPNPVQFASPRPEGRITPCVPGAPDKVDDEGVDPAALHPDAENNVIPPKTHQGAKRTGL